MYGERGREWCLVRKQMVREGMVFSEEANGEGGNCV